MKRRFLVPKESYFPTPSKSIYGVESKKNLSYSMTQDSCEPYSTEKTCKSLNNHLRFYTGLDFLPSLYEKV